MAKRYIEIIREVFYLSYYGKLGGVADLYDISVHDRKMFLRELYKIKAQEEKEMKAEQEKSSSLKF